MWIFEHFYWILIIGFAVISAISKSGKSKPKQNPRGMPTFGGGNGMERRTHSASPQAAGSPHDERETDSDSRAGWGNVGDVSRSEGWDSETAQRSRRSYEFQGPGPDYDTGEGVSAMWEEERPETLDDYDKAMERHLEQVNASLNRIEKTAAPAPANQAAGGQPASRLASEARRGLIWAEVLGPPRSKRPYGGRK